MIAVISTEVIVLYVICVGFPVDVNGPLVLKLEARVLVVAFNLNFPYTPYTLSCMCEIKLNGICLHMQFNVKLFSSSQKEVDYFLFLYLQSLCAEYNILSTRY